MNESTATTSIFKKIASLEQQLQKLKVQAYLNLPKKRGVAASRYEQTAINKALKATRNNIWLEKYARKIKGLS